MSTFYTCIVNGNIIKVRLTNESICILNSYLVKDDNDKIEIIDELCFIFSQILNTRTRSDIFYEWKACNILYSKNIFKKRTRDTNIELNLKSCYKMLYKLICLFFKEK